MKKKEKQKGRTNKGQRVQVNRDDDDDEGPFVFDCCILLPCYCEEEGGGVLSLFPVSD